MKHNSDTEIDLLLGRHGRRAARSSSAGAGARAKSEAAAVKNHPDADELSAYAEGALPDAARSRYVAHLADCDSCRKIVAGIIISSGVEVEEKVSAAETASEPRTSWRAWLAALFSPPVLRYAVPALALFAVIAIVLVVSRRGRDEPSFVAKNEPAQQQTANTASEDKQTTGTTSTATEGSNENQAAPAATNANRGETKTGEAEERSQSQSTENSTPAQTTEQESADVSKMKTTTPSSGSELGNAPPQIRTENDPRAATPSPAASAPADTVAGRPKEKDEDTMAAQKRQRPEGGAGARAPVYGAANSRANRETQTTGDAEYGASSGNAGADSKSRAPEARPGATSTRSRRDSTVREDGAETRVVAGRTFRRQSGVWIDTAYNSSRSVTRVRRGSEQYRALAGDEPVIGAVGSQLSGDVIVVVGSRAYRIY